MINSPLVSIILPVYNAEKYITYTIKSILNQSYLNIELIVIDDGSKDNSKLEILKFKDKRLKLITRENKGLIYTLNEAISMAKGKYIARIDADDICDKNRISKQVDFLEKNNIAIVGSNFKVIDEENKITAKVSLCSTYEDIKRWFFIGNPICHPSVMINYELVGNDFYYDSFWEAAEDFELWLRLSKKYKIYNMEDYLLSYRIHNNSISSKKSSFQILQTNRLKEKYYNDSQELYLKKLINDEFKLINRPYILNKIGKLSISLRYLIHEIINNKKLDKLTLKIVVKFIMKNDHENFIRQ